MDASSMPIKVEKLRNRTLRERIYEEVVQLILSGELPSGGWVNEKQVIDRLRVSRTPFREAAAVAALRRGDIKAYAMHDREFCENVAGQSGNSALIEALERCALPFWSAVASDLRRR